MLRRRYPRLLALLPATRSLIAPNRREPWGGRPSRAMTLAAEPTPVLVIAGPTAVGKSALALEICGLIQGEIVSADSVQVYTGLEVGANKATAAERAQVRHHLIDVADPTKERFTAGRFVREAELAIDDIVRRNKVPVVVGGTPLYLQWLVHGVPLDAPASDPRAARAAAAKLAPFEGAGDWEGGLEILKALDGKRASELSANDWYRLGRAIEIATAKASAGPSAGLPEAKGKGRAEASAEESKYDFRCVFLCPSDRRRLFESIDDRCERMLLGAEGPGRAPERPGLLQETAALLVSRRLSPGAMASLAIGYRQVSAHI
mmetsp:Transcript_66072/g.149122  ORF Transcript_66072/g.149122 Transcript_66072/m.149122 type:complete len:319 (+) Transcript_66072:55-1011(+)